MKKLLEISNIDGHLIIENLCNCSPSDLIVIARNIIPLAFQKATKVDREKMLTLEKKVNEVCSLMGEMLEVEIGSFNFASGVMAMVRAKNRH